jgi:hypothetical protein
LDSSHCEEIAVDIKRVLFLKEQPYSGFYREHAWTKKKSVKGKILRVTAQWKINGALGLLKY